MNPSDLDDLMDPCPEREWLRALAIRARERREELARDLQESEDLDLEEWAEPAETERLPLAADSGRPRLFPARYTHDDIELTASVARDGRPYWLLRAGPARLRIRFGDQELRLRRGTRFFLANLTQPPRFVEIIDDDERIRVDAE